MVEKFKAIPDIKSLKLMIRFCLFVFLLPLVLFSQSHIKAVKSTPPVQSLTSQTILKLFSVVKYKNITVSDGLSQGLVLCIIQDYRGYMWFGTKDGLNRYDGYNFTVYKHNTNDSTSISNNYISALFEDSKNRLWIGTDKGLNLYMPETDRFSKIQMKNDGVASLKSNAVRSISEDNEGAIWVGTENGGLDKLSFSGQNQLVKIKHYPLKELYTPLLKNLYKKDRVNRVMGFAKSDEAVYSAIWDKNNHLWLSARIFRLSYTFIIKTELNSGWTKQVIDSTSVFKNTLAEKAPNGTMWLLNQNGLMQYSYKNNSFTPYPIPSNYKSKVKSNHFYFTEIPLTLKKRLELKDSARFIWFFSSDGFFIFETSTKSYSFIPFPDEMDQNLPGLVSSFFMDKSGMVWLGSGGYGLFTFNPNFQRFSYPNYHLKDDIPLFKSSIQDHSLLWIHKDIIDPDIVWFSSYSTLFRANRKTELFEPFSSRINGSHKSRYVEGGPILQDEHGNLWVGSVDGLDFINRKEKSIKLFKTVHKGIFNIYDDSEGSFWITQRPNILARFDRELETFEYFPLSNQMTNTIAISAESSPCIYQSKNGFIWVGTATGLYCFDPKLKKVIQHYLNVPGAPNSLSSNNIFTISADPLEPDKYFWIGTAGGGLNRFDMKEGTFHHFTEEDGLPNNTVYAILADESGNLWLSTNKGLAKFDVKKRKFHNYTPMDGLQGNEFNRFAHHKAADGEMFFGGVSGLNHFYPKNIRVSSFVPDVVISHFLYFDPTRTNISDGWIDLISTGRKVSVELPYYANTLSIEYAALDYNNPKKKICISAFGDK